MTQNQRFTSVFGSPYQILFQNGDPHPMGDLITAGVGFPSHNNSWIDTRDLWTFPYYNLSIMLEDVQANYRNARGHKCALDYGCFLIGFPDMPQKYAPAISHKWGELFIGFAGTLFRDMQEQDILSPARPVWRLHNPEPWIARLHQFVQEPTGAAPQQRLSRAVHFLHYLLQMQEEATPLPPTETALDWFDRACYLLVKNLRQPTDLAAIADELGMSYNTFRNYFKRRAGMAPLEYRNHMRLKTACELLATCPLKKCREIAFVVGFADEQQFTRHFKKRLGLTPLEYRKQHAKP